MVIDDKDDERVDRGSVGGRKSSHSRISKKMTGAGDVGKGGNALTWCVYIRVLWIHGIVLESWPARPPNFSLFRSTPGANR